MKSYINENRVVRPAVPSVDRAYERGQVELIRSWVEFFNLL